MYWINFEKWDSSHQTIFNYERVYKKGYIWTPFVKISIRFKPWYRCVPFIGVKREED